MIDPGLPEWRLLLWRLHASFRAASFKDAAAFVARVADIGDADVDVRPPGIVHVSVRHDDVESAKAIGEAAASAGLEAVPSTVSVSEVAIDAIDIPKVKAFWRALLNYVDDGDDAVADPARIGPPFWFQQMDEPRTERNRFHIDVTVPHDVAAQRIEAALAAGGTLLTDKYARAFWVLADPEGNEACICTWQDRDRS